MPRFTYKIICLILILTLVLTACGAGVKPPAPASSFTVNALYKAGDFSYSCVIARSEEMLSVTAVSTNAAGLCITCDGTNVTFEKGNMKESFPMEETQKSNPAVLLYSVFEDVFCQEVLPSAGDGLYYYRSDCVLGDYTLSVNTDGSLNTLLLPQGGITVIFD